MVRALHAVSPVPFELWREDGVLRVVLCRFVSIDTAEVKVLVRMLGSLDEHGVQPVVVESEEHVRFTPDARVLLSRCRMGTARPVAFVGNDRSDRDTAELFAHYLEPSFPFRSFGCLGDALDWSARWKQAPRMRVVHAC